jgi:hypothetical protein
MNIDPVSFRHYFAQQSAYDLKMLGQIKISRSEYLYFESLGSETH